jgi:transposase-like protein
LATKRLGQLQIVRLLEQHGSGRKVADLAREAQVSPTTIYAWKRKFGEVFLDSSVRVSMSSDTQTLKSQRYLHQVSVSDYLRDIGRVLSDATTVLRSMEAALLLLESQASLQLNKGMLRELNHRCSMSLENLRSEANLLIQISTSKAIPHKPKPAAAR